MKKGCKGFKKKRWPTGQQPGTKSGHSPTTKLFINCSSCSPIRFTWGLTCSCVPRHVQGGRLRCSGGRKREVVLWAHRWPRHRHCPTPLPHATVPCLARGMSRFWIRRITTASCHYSILCTNAILRLPFKFNKISSMLPSVSRSMAYAESHGITVVVCRLVLCLGASFAAAGLRAAS